MTARRAVVRLAMSSLRARTAGALATFVAVVLGGALLVACGGLFETAIRLDAAPQRLSGVPIVVGGSPGFRLPDQESQTVPYTERARVPADLAARISGIAGVRVAIPDVSFPAIVRADRRPARAGQLSGHAWDSAALTPYTLRSGVGPAAGQVVVDEDTARAAGLGPGDPVTIAVNGEPAEFTVAGVARPTVAVAAPALFFSTADVARFNRQPGTVDLVGVLPESGVDDGDLARRIERELGAGFTVRTGGERGVAEFVGVDTSRLPLFLLPAVFGGMVLIVMALVVSATVSLTVRQRRRELALLRATGATPRQVHRMVVVETMVVAAFAALAGAALGRLVGSLIFSISADRGVFPEALVFRQGPVPYAAGALVALAVPFVTAVLAARPAAATRPIQALEEAAIPAARVHPVRRLLALVSAVGTVALAATTPFLGPEVASATAGPAVLTGAIAAALVAPELLAWAMTRWGPQVRRIAGAGGELAVINTRIRAVAYAAVLTPITVASAIALGNVYTQTTLNAAAVDGYTGEFRADVVVTSAAGGVPPALVETIRATPGVAAASALVTSRGWIEGPYDGKGSDPVRLIGLDAQGRAGVLGTRVTAGSLQDLRGNAVAVPRHQADDLGFGVGEIIRLRLGDGTPIEATVVALMDGSSRYPSLVLPADLLAAHTTGKMPTHVLVRAERNRDAADLTAAVRRHAGDRHGVTVGGSSLLREVFATGPNVEAWINYLLAVLAIAYAAIAAVNTLAVAVLGRRAEFGAQRLAGATRRQVRRMLLVEGTIVAVLGLVLGAVIAMFSVWPAAFATGAPVPTGPVWYVLAVAGAVFLMVWPVSLLAARLAMNRGPLDAIAAPGQ